MISTTALAGVFLKLGTTAFGGPAAHIAMMRQEFVERRKWVSEDDFLDLLGAANLIPGPSSTELAIHLGYKLCGWRGLLMAGACFILPAAILVGLLAWIYREFGALPQTASVMKAIQPVVVAIVLDAVRGLAMKSLRTLPMLLVGVAALLLAALGLHPLVILVGCGVVVMLMRRAGVMSLLPVTVGGAATSVSLFGIFSAFLKIGSVVFGSGYVLLAFLQSDLVDDRHWLTTKQLLDAVAVGQVTPGPVFTTATFIGYLLAGIPGAIVATVAIFLPGFVLVALSGPLIPRIRRSKAASAFLDGVTAGSIALIAWVLVTMGRASLVNATSIGLAIASYALLVRFRVNSAWLILGAGLIGLLSH